MYRFWSFLPRREAVDLALPARLTRRVNRSWPWRKRPGSRLRRGLVELRLPEDVRDVKPVERALGILSARRGGCPNKRQTQKHKGPLKWAFNETV